MQTEPLCRQIPGLYLRAGQHHNTKRAKHAWRAPANFRLALLTTAVLSASAWAAQDAATASHAVDMEKGTALFNSDVAALLTDHCVKCHGGEKGTKGALDLTTRELALKGGDTGPAFVPAIKATL